MVLLRFGAGRKPRSPHHCEDASTKGRGQKRPSGHDFRDFRSQFTKMVRNLVRSPLWNPCICRVCMQVRTLHRAPSFYRGDLMIPGSRPLGVAGDNAISAGHYAKMSAPQSLSDAVWLRC